MASTRLFQQHLNVMTTKHVVNSVPIALQGSPTRQLVQDVYDLSALGLQRLKCVLIKLLTDDPVPARAAKREHQQT